MTWAACHVVLGFQSAGLEVGKKLALHTHLRDKVMSLWDAKTGEGHSLQPKIVSIPTNENKDHYPNSLSRIKKGLFSVRLGCLPRVEFEKNSTEHRIKWGLH